MTALAGLTAHSRVGHSGLTFSNRIHCCEDPHVIEGPGGAQTERFDGLHIRIVDHGRGVNGTVEHVPALGLGPDSVGSGTGIVGLI